MDGHRPAFDLGQKSQCSMLVVYHHENNAVFCAHFAVRARLNTIVSLQWARQVLAGGNANSA